MAAVHDVAAQGPLNGNRVRVHGYVERPVDRSEDQQCHGELAKVAGQSDTNQAERSQQHGEASDLRAAEPSGESARDLHGSHCEHSEYSGAEAELTGRETEVKPQ